MGLKLILSVALLASSPSYALDFKPIKLHAVRQYIGYRWENSNSQMLIPMTEAVADVVNALDPTKRYACSIKSIDNIAIDTLNGKIPVQIFEISNCVMQR